MDLLPTTKIELEREERAKNGEPSNPAASLLKLPTELLSIIVSHVEFGSLANFALVSRDCCQLARLRQFSSICFDYSPSSSELLARLIKEKNARVRSESSSHVSPSADNTAEFGDIGSCVEYVTVEGHPKWLKHFHGIPGQKFNDLEVEVLIRKREKSGGAQAKYMTLVGSIVSSRAALPHLNTLQWAECASVEQSFFNDLVRSPIQHVKGLNISVNRDFELVLPPLSQRWNPRTIFLDLGAIKSGYFEKGKATPGASILRTCSHSLEYLYWSHNILENEKDTFGSGHAAVPRFEKLRALELYYSAFKDIDIAKALVDAPLSKLNVRYCSDDFIAKALSMQGSIRSLDTFLFSLRKSSSPQYMNFLEVNQQISSLSIFGAIMDSERNMPHGYLEDHILPILSSSFHNLRSLCLEWSSTVTVLPEIALAIISGMQTLEQLCLSAGNQATWEVDWLIDHKIMRYHLSKLSKLKIIAFQKDTYELDTIHGPAVPGRYYVNLFPEPWMVGSRGFNMDNPDAWSEQWEKGHMQRMSNEASDYASLMSQLEWIYFGQLPMTVRRYDAGRHSVFSSEYGRDINYRLLNRMFGWEGMRLD